MTKFETALLHLLRAALHSEIPNDPKLDPEEWGALLKRAETHKLLPIILDAAIRLPSCRASLAQGLPAWEQNASHDPDEGRSDWRSSVFAQVNRQVVQENEFLNLILALRERGLEPLVVKSAVCRKLYPKPLLRPSVDDDLLIPPE